MKIIHSAYIGLTVILWATSAYAYVDPGSSLLLIQGLLAAVGGLLLFAKTFVQRTKALIAKLKNRNRA
jgi:hypothetical protein